MEMLIHICSFDIKWYELELELTDHFISVIEEILEKDRN
jgi:hypothetical protein